MIKQITMASLLVVATYPNISAAHLNGANHPDCNGNESKITDTYKYGYLKSYSWRWGGKWEQREYHHTYPNYDHSDHSRRCETDWGLILAIVGVVGGIYVIAGTIIYFKCGDFFADIKKCREYQKSKEKFVELKETIQQSPIKPMFYVDDQEQKLGLRYTIKF